MDDAKAGLVEGQVVALAASAKHAFSKDCCSTIEVVAGLGVVGDAHSGTTVQHRSRVAKDPSLPNLRQVHLIHRELLDTLSSAGYAVEPGQLGENITTSGLDLLALPRGTILHVGKAVRLEVTGLRNPCAQIEAFRPGLLKQVAKRRADGSTRRLAGIMCIARASGTVQSGDIITAKLPPLPHLGLQPV